ncbi:MAG: diguanylate cyclase [Candidatus Limnocylindrales bacterium]
MPTSGGPTSAPTSQSLLTLGGAATLLGVHANTVRAWTDQGHLTCLRMNARGDRRYRRQDIERFLLKAGRATPPPAIQQPFRAERLPALSQVGDDSRRVTLVLNEVARLAAGAEGFDQLVADVAAVLCTLGGYEAAGLVAQDGQVAPLVGRMRADRRIFEQVIATGRPIVGRARRQEGSYRAGLPVAVGTDTPTVMLVAGIGATSSPEEDSLLRAVAAQIEIAGLMRARVADAAEGRRRTEFLMAISADIGSQLDMSSILSQLLERSMELFHADHGGVFSWLPNGSFRTLTSRNLSIEFCERLERVTTVSVSTLVFEEQRVISIADYPEDPRSVEVRDIFLREKINTLTVAPLFSDGNPLGEMALYHDSHFEWSPPDLALLEQLARQASTVLRNARNYEQMATWAAQLQSIQQLGSRLTRLRTVEEIGHAICAELNQLIAFHNVRVYRLEDNHVLPVAWRGEIGEYEGEDMEQLKLEIGEGITGWVARYGLAQNVTDAAKDRRAKTIPGTEDDLDESLLLAPMLFEDAVIGVIVLAKLGLNQFTADDLRLLEIYASIAAQAMSNADATERLRAQPEALERQLNNQRELLRVTESILSTLDTQALLEEIAERLKTLVQVDNICVSVHDQRAGVLRPIFARGVQAREYLAAIIPDDQGVGGYVLKTGEAQLVQDELADERVVHFDSLGPEPGAMIVAPLRGADRIRGVLTIERLGVEAAFAEEEFELVKLFAAHVSIALQNAETHRAVELRAETDTLTGLWNHGALIDHVDVLVGQRTPFAMLMVDLDFFKRYNDRFGHQAGNVKLKQISAMLQLSCRETDHVFRYGGDEFVLVLPNTSVSGARRVAEKIQEAVMAANDDHASAVPLTCSIGMATYPKDGDDGQSIILAADRACYAGKRAGRARIATALEGLALAAEFQPTEPVPLDSPINTGVERRSTIDDAASTADPADRARSYSAV